jgi:undecaprenyl diphosphate synthase
MHIALIADGNGRWGMSHYGERALGHEEGAKALHRLIESMPQDVSHFTFYGLSRDNIRKRPQAEIDGLYQVIEENLNKALEMAERNNIRLAFIGDRELPGSLTSAIQKSVWATQRNTGLVFTLALSYSGRNEIIRAAAKVQSWGEPINRKTFPNGLDTWNLPDVDLLIRTGGEKRLSDFMLWQCAYAELFFVDTLFPDFTVGDLEAIIAEYYGRERRFGGLTTEETELINEGRRCR